VLRVMSDVKQQYVFKRKKKYPKMTVNGIQNNHVQRVRYLSFEGDGDCLRFDFFFLLEV